MEVRLKNIPCSTPHAFPKRLSLTKDDLALERNKAIPCEFSQIVKIGGVIDIWRSTSSVDAVICPFPDPCIILGDDDDCIVDLATTGSFYNESYLKPLLDSLKLFSKPKLLKATGKQLVLALWYAEATNVQYLDDLRNIRSLGKNDLLESVVPKDKIRLEDGNQYERSTLSIRNPKCVPTITVESCKPALPLSDSSSRDADSILISRLFSRREPLMSVANDCTVDYHQAAVGLRGVFDNLVAHNICAAHNYAKQFDGLFKSQNDCDLDGTSYSHEERAVEDSEFACSGIESTETECIWRSEYSIDPSVLEEGHPFKQIQRGIVNDALAMLHYRQRTFHTRAPTSVAKDGVANKFCDRTIVTSSEKKRSRGKESSSDDATENGRGKGVRGKRSRTSKKESGHQVLFACPFAKKDPIRYRSCYAYVLNRVRDVKQHLSRFHQLPIYCPRCMSIFTTEDERDRHNRQCSSVVQDARTYEGVTRAQKDQLAERVSSGMSQEDQWFTVFDILFPGHKPRPKSPYMNMDLSLDLERFQDLMHAEGPNIISAAIRTSGIEVATIANEERDLAALLQSAIGEGLQTIAQRWSASLISEQMLSQIALADDPENSQTGVGSYTLWESSDTLVEGSEPRLEQPRSDEERLSIQNQESRITLQQTTNVDIREPQQSDDRIQSNDALFNSTSTERLYDDLMYDATIEAEFWNRVELDDPL